jgi:hypothetical protein
MPGSHFVFRSSSPAPLDCVNLRDDRFLVAPISSDQIRRAGKRSVA